MRKFQTSLEIGIVGFFFLYATNAISAIGFLNWTFILRCSRFVRIKFKMVKLLCFPGQPIRVTIGARGKSPFLIMR